MKTLSRLQFFQRVARHRTPALPAEVEHSCADDQMERMRRDNSEAIVFLVIVVCASFAAAAGVVIVPVALKIFQVVFLHRAN